jgi:hypothetical protein
MPYVDPGTGSFVLQAVAAALAGVLVVANGYWKRLKARLGRRPASPSDPEAPSGPSHD